MNKRIYLILLVVILAVASSVPAYAAPANLKWYNSGDYVTGRIGGENFGVATATADVAEAYVAQRVRFHATSAVSANSKRVTVAFYKTGSTTSLASVTRTSNINASAGQYYPSSGYLDKIGTSPFEFVKSKTYYYKLTSTMPDDIEGIYGGYLSSVSG